MDKVKVRITSEDEERTVIIEKKYLELLDIIYEMFCDGNMFDYYVLPDEEKVIDFTV